MKDENSNAERTFLHADLLGIEPVSAELMSVLRGTIIPKKHRQFKDKALEGPVLELPIYE